jgi:glycosyltransferase involved in cell wall biosynthesis
LWGHGVTDDESGPKWWIRSVLYRIATGQLLYGNHAKKLLVQKGLDPEDLHVVFNSLDYDQQVAIASRINPTDIAAWRHQLGVKPNEGLVVFTGRLQSVKRLDHLLDAVGKLAKQGSRVHVAIVGDGNEKATLAEQAIHLDIADLVHFLGASYDEEFLGIALTASDLCVIPSGAGLSVMHSLVYGTPVLIHDNCADHFPEWEAVKEGKTGFFYQHGDRNDLAEKIRAAIFPAPKRNAMVDDCKAVIRERYNPHVQVERFVQAVLWSLKAKTKG